MADRNIEIERKFLVDKLPKNLCDYESEKIRQAYISTNPTIRLRQLDDTYIFTFKGSGRMSKTEFEYPLTEEQFDELYKKSEGNTISKTRYLIPLDDGLTAELDVYHDDLIGFVNVEVEFNTIEEAKNFVPPAWFGKEVTGISQYSNAYLSKYGLSEEHQ